MGEGALPAAANSNFLYSVFCIRMTLANTSTAPSIHYHLLHSLESRKWWRSYNIVYNIAEMSAHKTLLRELSAMMMFMVFVLCISTDLCCVYGFLGMHEHKYHNKTFHTTQTIAPVQSKTN